jgi:hypothetical protein
MEQCFTAQNRVLLSWKSGLMSTAKFYVNLHSMLTAKVSKVLKKLGKLETKINSLIDTDDNNFISLKLYLLQQPHFCFCFWWWGLSALQP